MTPEELIEFVKSELGYKVSQFYIIDNVERDICFKMYNTFKVKCGISPYHSVFGIGIMLHDGIALTEFLGEDDFLDSDEQSIKRSLEILDEYCRLRLSDEFLYEYYKKYNN